MGCTSSKPRRPTQIAGDPKLPQELVDEILDHLAEDTRTLRSCSLVAKSWISPSRRHLFSTLVLNPEGILEWNKTFPNPEDSPAGHVRQLFIPFQTNVPINFADRMPYFSNVQQLCFTSLYASVPSSISALGPLPPTIRSVGFTLSTIPIADFISVIQQLPNLDDLSFWIASLTGEVSAVLRKPIQKRLGGKLLINGGSLVDILDTLTEIPPGPKFVEVEIHSILPPYLPAVFKFVRACQDTLTKLHIITLGEGRSLHSLRA